jgi:hemerythrin HHE cation binding domain-containing protein
MKAAFGEISRILEAHTSLEERFFYPCFEKHEHLHQLIQEAREQHDLVKQLLDGMKHQNDQEFKKIFKRSRPKCNSHDLRGRRDLSPGPEFDGSRNSGPSRS